MMRTLAAWLCIAFLAGCDETKGPDGFDTDSDAVVEDCGDGLDNDSDGFIDCDDDDCVSVCDVDGDGHVSTALGGDDCDDNNGAVYPGNTEVCDGIDNNCNGLVDSDDPNVDVSDSGWYADGDGDGFGNPSQVVYQCDPPPGDAVQNGDDCDDNDRDVHPNAQEVCNNIDDNCDGLIDDGDPTVDPATFRTWSVDADGDGYGDPLLVIDACRPPSGYTNNADDCDDSDANVNPAATEICDNLDNDCDTFVDNLTDRDLDGFIECGLTPDCDDFDPLVYPGAPEFCDGIDNNCDGLLPADENDIDGDGLMVCEGDCDDADPGLGLAADWYQDLDGDGWGAGIPVLASCLSPGQDWVPYLGDDCDDTDPLVYPGAYDFCGDYFDADCDGDDCGCGAGLVDGAYVADIQFQDAPLQGTTMTMTWDGVDYWSSSGGGAAGDRIAQYDGNGAFLAVFQPQVDWRALFTKEDGIGPVYGRGYSSNQIKVMDVGPNNWNNDVTLVGGSLDGQSSVAFDANRREFVTLNPNGDVQRWDESGGFAGPVTLQGFGGLGNEGSYPQDRGVAWACDQYLTYSDETLSSWDSTTGVRLSTTTLTGAGTTFDANFSISYANGRVFIVTIAGGFWQGYDVF